MTQNGKEKPDAFKAVMAAARTEPGRPELAHQSKGRELSQAEEVLADTLMDIYGSGVSGADAVAKALTEKGVASPISGRAEWTAESVAAHFAALNADLDEAYSQNGIGG